MKILVECKRKTCVPPLNWEGKYKGTPRQKIVTCALCKSLKAKEVK